MSGKLAALGSALSFTLAGWERERLQDVVSAEAGLWNRQQAVETMMLERLEPHREALELLQTMPGIDRVAAASILAETGPDMSVFCSAQAYAAWASRSLGNNETAGKRRHGAPSPLGKARVSHSPCSSAPPHGQAPRPSSSCGSQSLRGRGARLAGIIETNSLGMPRGGIQAWECSRRKGPNCHDFETMHLHCRADALLGSRRYRGAICGSANVQELRPGLSNWPEDSKSH